MKRLHLPFLCLLVGVFTFLYYACQKGESRFALPAQNSDLELFTQAQAYFTTILRKAPAPTPYSAGNFNLLGNLDKTLIWSSAYILGLSVGKAVVIPISFAGNLLGQPSWEGARFSMNSTAKLVVFRDPLGQFHATVVTGYPNRTAANYFPRSFAGIALGQDWSGAFIAGYTFPAKVKVTALANPFAGQPQSRTQPTEDELVTTVCNYIDWYSYTADELFINLDFGCSPNSLQRQGGIYGPLGHMM